MWRVEQSLALEGRYYVVRGYEVGRRWKEMWTNELGAGDFTDPQRAQHQANILNEEEGDE